MAYENQVVWAQTTLLARPIWLARTKRGLCRLDLGEQSREKFLGALAKAFPDSSVIPGALEDFMPYLRQLRMYLSGEKVALALPLDLSGTDFQRSVWQALREIPYGSTRTYAEIAHTVGRPKAYRAVGGACHNNPVLLFVPCHRVVGSDGSLVGFGGGLDLKRELLALERLVVGK